MESPWVSGGGRIANTLAVEGFWKALSVDGDGSYNLSLTRAGTEDGGWGGWLAFMLRHSNHLLAPTEWDCVQVRADMLVPLRE